MKDVTNALQLYRDCLRLVAYVSKQNGGDKRIMQEQVRAAFRKNKDEKDPSRIEEQILAAQRGLGNFLFYETKRLAEIEKRRGGGGQSGAGSAAEGGYTDRRR